MPCLQGIIALPFTVGERKIWQNIKNSQNIIKMIEGQQQQLKLRFLCRQLVTPSR